jgi:hypothetical protein
MFSLRTIAVIGALVTGMATATAVHAQEPDPLAPMPAPSGGDEVFRKGTLGFSFPVTLISNVASGVLGTGERVPTVDIVYFLSDKAAVDLIAGVNIHRKQENAVSGGTEDVNLFGYAAGVGYRMYRSKNNLRSFIEPQAVITWSDTATSDTFGLNLGASLGAERNITPWFSFSGAIGGTLNFTNSFKDIQLATSVNLAANLYWR